MSTAKKIGRYNMDRTSVDTSIYREADGTVWVNRCEADVIANLPYNECAVPLFDPGFGESLEGFIAALRAACTDPREQVIAAARAFIAAEGADDSTFEALVSAVELLEETECDTDDEA